MKKIDWKVALVALGLHWLAILAAYCLMRGSDPNVGSLFSLLRERFTTAGDAPHYLSIATEGYQSTGEKANLIVFYPFYPLLIALFTLVTRNAALSGILLSQVCYCAASVVLFRLLAKDHDERAAWQGTLLMALYPFGIFTMGVFTESLFLLLTLLTLYAIRERRYGAAGAFGFLAAFTRTQGMLLLAPALYEWIVSRKSRRGWFVFCIPLGFGAYLLINRVLQGSFFRFLEHQAAPPWYQTTKWISENLAQHFDMAQAYPGLAFIIYGAQIALYFLTAAALFYGLWRGTRTCYLVYGAAYLIFTYFSGWMISGGRYMLCCVPLFLIAADIKSERARRLLLAASTLLFAICTYLFLRGYAIM